MRSRQKPFVERRCYPWALEWKDFSGDGDLVEVRLWRKLRGKEGEGGGRRTGNGGARGKLGLV